jgi:hypothetical protein
LAPTDEDDTDDILEDEPPPTPDYTMSDDEVADTEFQYSDRHPADWVLSGPLGKHGGGPGRRFPSWDWAEVFARKLHGNRVLRRIPEAALNGGNRWAFLIRGQR